MLSILVGILIFGLIVLIHELGHFLLAKLNGIGVVEFSIGMGPRLISVVRGGTRYSIKLLPFGGSCMMLGEDGKETEEEDLQNAFNRKSVPARMSVIAAGPVFNFILAFIGAMGVVLFSGRDIPVIRAVRDGFPAQEAGLKAGDKITGVNDRTVFANRDLTVFLMSHPGETLVLTYERLLPEGQTEQRQVTLTPKFSAENQAYMVGVEFEGYQEVGSFAELLSASAYEVKFCVTSTFDGFRMIFKKIIPFQEAFAGPIRLGPMMGDSIQESVEVAGVVGGIFAISNWCLMLSAGLGLMNLLPIPALDGGRLLFLLVELVRGKPIDPEKEGIIHLAGFMLLMTLMVYVLFNDIKSFL